MNYPSMKIVIANSICNVAVSRFPHRQASVVAKKKKGIFGDENRAQNVHLWPTPLYNGHKFGRAQHQ